MTEAKIQAIMANCVVALVRHDMLNRSMTDELAYRSLYASELYRLLMNPATRLYLEPNRELVRLYDIEVNRGASALLDELRNEKK